MYPEDCVLDFARPAVKRGMGFVSSITNPAKTKAGTNLRAVL